MTAYFIQIDRCNAGVRLTCREATGRTGKERETLVRQPWMNDAEWLDRKQRWLGLQPIFADTAVHSWKDDAHIGMVQDLLDGRIDENADHG